MTGDYSGMGWWIKTKEPFNITGDYSGMGWWMKIE